MSGNAIKGSMPINGVDAEQEAKRVIAVLKRDLGIDAITLGSTGKKPADEFSGDIDIAIKMVFNSENVGKISHVLFVNFGTNMQIYPSYGFKILSFGLTYGLFKNLVQVDLMFSSDLEYSKFMYHSPNFRKHESNFKGLYRTNLLCYVIGRMPTGINDIYDEDNNLTDYWKYTLTYDKGLMLTHKTFKGKTKLLSKAVTKESLPITKDVNEIIKYALGQNASIETTNSFETLITYLFSDDYKYGKDVLFNILNDYFSDERHADKRTELIQYMFDNILLKNVKYDDIFKNFLKNIL